MNKIVQMGRLVADPEIRYTSGENATCIANFRIAVDKRFKKRDDSDTPTADFFRVTAFGKLGEFVEKYLKRGTKIVYEGRIENANYTDKDGNKVFRDQIIAENIEFAESKKAQEEHSAAKPNVDDFINTGVDDLNDNLPWS
jgi:single-strand DNA-binding protein